MFDTCAVVPGAVKQHDLATGGQMLHIALEVPLRLFPRRRCAERRNPADSGVERLADALDHPTFARCVAALKNHDNPGPGFDNPLLELDQFEKKPFEFLLVGLLRKLGLLPLVQVIERETRHRLMLRGLLGVACFALGRGVRRRKLDLLFLPGSIFLAVITGILALCFGPGRRLRRLCARSLPILRRGGFVARCGWVNFCHSCLILGMDHGALQCVVG